MAALDINPECDCRRRNAKPKRDDDARLKRRARELVETEIAFIYRPKPNESDEPAIDDLDAFLAELDRLDQAEGDSGVEADTAGRPFLPLPDHLLTPDQERRLFVQMNYLKCRANALRSRLDPDGPSRSRVQKIEKLMTDAGRIRDRLCESNLRLVLSIARKLSNSQNQFEDLVSDGFPILMRCVELFDASRGFRFSTYVTHSVQRHLYRVLQRSQRRRKRQPATDSEILNNVPEAEPSEIAEIDHAALCDSILQAAHADLDARETLILKRRFGLDGDRPQTLRQIAGDLDISKERVRQLQLRALDKLHEAAAELNLKYEPN